MVHTLLSGLMVYTLSKFSAYTLWILGGNFGPEKKIFSEKSSCP